MGTGFSTWLWATWSSTGSSRPLHSLRRRGGFQGRNRGNRGSRFREGSDYVFATTRGTPFLHHNVSRRVPRRRRRRRSRSRRAPGALPRPAPHLRQSPDHRHQPRRRPGQPHPRPRPHEHDPGHLHTSLSRLRVTAPRSVPSSRGATSRTSSRPGSSRASRPAGTSAPPTPRTRSGCGAPPEHAATALPKPVRYLSKT